MKLRPSSVDRMHEAFAAAAEGWDELFEDAFFEYAVAHGVAHILTLGDDERASELLLDVHFFENLLEVQGFLYPLQLWQILGFERAQQGYRNVSMDIQIVDDESDEPIEADDVLPSEDDEELEELDLEEVLHFSDTMERVAEFCDYAGWYDCAHDIRLHMIEVLLDENQENLETPEQEVLMMAIQQARIGLGESLLSIGAARNAEPIFREVLEELRSCRKTT